MSLPTSISLDNVHKRAAHLDTSPRESSCERITQLFFDSPRKKPSVKMQKHRVKEEAVGKTEKIQHVVEHSPLAAAKIKKNPLERSKSLHNLQFQENGLYTPPKSEKKSEPVKSEVESLPVCGDVFREPILNAEWIKKMEKCVLQGTLRIEHTLEEFLPIWRSQIQEEIDRYYRRAFGHSCLSEEVLQRPPQVLPEQLHRDSALDEMIYFPYRELLRRVSDVLDQIVVKLRERTPLIDALRHFLNHAIYRTHTMTTFMSNLKKIISQHREFNRLLAKILIPEKTNHGDLLRYLEPFKHEAEMVYEDCLRQIKWFHDQSRMITFKQVYKWSQTHGDPVSMSQIERPQIIRSITTYGKRVIDLTINGLEAEQTLEGIVHQINRAGIDRFATAEVSTLHAKAFEKNQPIPCDGVLRLLSMGCWFHADQLIRKWLGDLYEAPLHTKCKKGITSEVQINSPEQYIVRQIKTFCVHSRRIPNDPECYTVLDPPIGEVTFQWSVSPDSDLGWKGELRVLSWKLREEAPINLKWLFIQALTHYHS